MPRGRPPQRIQRNEIRHFATSQNGGIRAAPSALPATPACRHQGQDRPADPRPASSGSHKARLLRVCRPPGRVPDTQDNHIVTTNAVTDNVGVGCHNVTHGRMRHRTASIREFSQPVANLADIRGNLHRGLRIKIIEVIVSARDPVKRRLSPENAHALRPWRGNALAAG